MPVLHFPDPRTSPGDIIAVGGDLHWKTLVTAYRNGIFPWPMSGLPLPWFSPLQRAIIDFDDLHVPRTLAKARRNAGYEFTIDRAFGDVIAACSVVPRGEEQGTWILPPIIDAYTELHKRGYAHSVETWSGDRLVGGLYGVSVDGTFSGESMFFIEPNASKLALLHLIDHVRARGLDWVDIQVMTPHMRALGAKTIPRRLYLRRLEQTQAKGLQLWEGGAR